VVSCLAILIKPTSDVPPATRVSQQVQDRRGWCENCGFGADKAIEINSAHCKASVTQPDPTDFSPNTARRDRGDAIYSLLFDANNCSDAPWSKRREDVAAAESLVAVAREGNDRGRVKLGPCHFTTRTQLG
jgi:hypothetical protein